MGHGDTQQKPPKKAKPATTPLKSALKNSKAPSLSQPSVSRPSPSEDSKKLSLAKNSVKNMKVAQRITPVPTKTKAKLDKGKAKAAPDSSLKVYPSTFKVVAGTYEKLLYGLEGSFIAEDGTTQEKPTLKPIFIFPAHIGCVKAVAASPDGGKWLATGSTDEIIKVWDLRRRKEVGDLIQHEGSITYLDFPTRSHLVSASEDGTICIFRARDWVPLRVMKGHKGRVNSVAVHPSGKAGLSVGKDRTLRMWDLMRGKGTASMKLGKEGEIVRWSTDGSRFIVQAGSTLDIYSTNMTLLRTVTHPKRIQDVRFYQSTSGEEFLLVAAEDKKVSMYETKSDDNTSLPIVAEAIGHDNRVKAIDTLTLATSHSASKKSWTTIMSTVSSDGWIRIFDLSVLDSLATASRKDIKGLEAIATYDTKGSRLTCCTLADGETTTASITGKRKHEGEDENDGSNGEMEGLGEQVQDEENAGSDDSGEDD